MPEMTVNCAPHTFYDRMLTLMSAHFCAAIPNFRLMQIDIDVVPCKDDPVAEPPRIENATVLPKKPGRGADVNEAAVRKYAPK
jgi:L-alanine-DL-glutamate epimerase-like enolase superfamily enzyme